MSKTCAFYQNGKCTILKETQCENCTFFKTKEARALSAKQSHERVVELFYTGKYPNLYKYLTKIEKLKYKNKGDH